MHGCGVVDCSQHQHASSCFAREDFDYAALGACNCMHVVWINSRLDAFSAHMPLNPLQERSLKVQRLVHVIACMLFRTTAEGMPFQQACIAICCAGEEFEDAALGACNCMHVDQQTTRRNAFSASMHRCPLQERSLKMQRWLCCVEATAAATWAYGPQQR
jgi:hypothetical protein